MPGNGAEQLVSINQEVDTVKLEKVIPYQLAREIILQNPDDIVLMECHCRAASENPCMPLDVCIIIGEAMAKFVAEHHPEKSRLISGREALEVLRKGHERGHIHHAFLKEVMLASSGFIAAVDPSNCNGCGSCVTECTFHALQVIEGRLQIHSDACMGCGVCMSRCAYNALNLKHSPDRGQPFEIVTLMEKNNILSDQINRGKSRPARL